MKILFLCGSLESGRDGVGDYTRRLASELIRQGHNASIIALNDTHIKKIEKIEQESDGTQTSVLRIPSILSNKERHIALDEFINNYDPEWLSLQYVPYSFQKRGLPFGLVKQLAKIGKGRKWHIMFHELWVGMDTASPLLLRMNGTLQKYLIIQLVKTLQPTIINTNTNLYKYQLNKSGFQVSLLPLFGNIPVKFVKQKKEEDKLIFIVFGGIHFGADLEKFSEWLQQVQKDEKKNTKIWFVGKNGEDVKNWEKELQSKGIDFEIFGIQNEDTVSKLMSLSDIGIATTPYWLLEKSGSVAAMQEHSLPVICLAREWIPNNVDESFIHKSINKWSFSLTLHEIFNQETEPYTLQYVANILLKYINKNNGFTKLSLET
ncbi:hypothetical protein EZS27_000738 [termite gut metagenome]|uniref:Glycosyltransferase subfamily 4-like N-terminal domain-containing protein n=1 Tax=termite gut metagenome TaxID=433724 RepID=A0A5J4T2Q8_9ZZZZ